MPFNNACMNYPAILLLINPEDGQIISANNKAAEVYGYSIEELKALNIRDLNKLKSDQIEAEMELARNENRNFFHFPHLTATGKIIEMEVYSLPTIVDGKKLLLSSVYPCVERSYLNKEAMGYIEKNDEAVIVLDQNLRIINANQMFEENFLLKHEELCGCSLDFLLTDKEDSKALRSNLLKGETHSRGIKYKLKNGKVKFFMVLAVPTFMRTHFFGAVISFKEISEESASQIKQTEKKNKIVQTGEAKNEIKSDYLARMSHDMRTPMNAVMSYADFGLEENDPLKMKEYFKQIKNSSSYLMTLLNDILDLKKFESGTVSLSTDVITLNNLISNIKAVVSTKAKDKQIDFKIEIENMVDGNLVCDKMRVMEIIINIINNAFKYTPVNGKIIWRINSKKLENRVVFSNTVTDNGVGISKDVQKRIFEPFFQENNNLTVSEGGCGLGLTITKKFVDLMNGFVSVKSTLGQGSEFYVEIPLKVAENKFEIVTKEKKAKITFDSLRDKKILLCEDNIINSKIVVKILTEQGIAVECARNGEDGVEKARRNKYDAILMDIKMPVLCGLEATARIRTFDLKVPIIAISANAYADDIEQSLKVGMNMHLSKPIDKKNLFEVLDYLIK